MGQWEFCEGRAGALRLGGENLGSSTQREAMDRVPAGFRRHTTVCACVTVSATAQLVFPATAVAASPALLAAMAQNVHHGLLVAAAAARTLLSPPRSSSSRQRCRAQPGPKLLPAPAATTTAAATTMAVQPARAATATAAITAGMSNTAVQQQVRAAQQFLAGGIAGAVSKTLVAPLERISTLLMAPMAHQRFTVSQAAQHVWRDGGLGGLYRGHAATLIKIFPASAIQFAVFNGLKDRILAARQQQQCLGAAPSASSQLLEHQQSQDLANHERLVVGAAAGAAAACCCYPLEAMRTAMSVAGGVQGNLLQAAQTVVASHGVGALYCGFRAALVGDVLGIALGFTAYEIGNRIYRDFRGGVTAPPYMRGLIGACSAACVLTLTMPLELVRRRLQVQGLAGRPVLYSGAVDCIQQVLRKEGVAGFYVAAIPSYLKVVPSIGCMYFCFELLMSRMPPPPQRLLRPQPQQKTCSRAAEIHTVSLNLGRAAVFCCGSCRHMDLSHPGPAALAIANC